MTQVRKSEQSRELSLLYGCAEESASEQENPLALRPTTGAFWKRNSGGSRFWGLEVLSRVVFELVVIRASKSEHLPTHALRLLRTRDFCSRISSYDGRMTQEMLSTSHPNSPRHLHLILPSCAPEDGAHDRARKVLLRRARRFPHDSRRQFLPPAKATRPLCSDNCDEIRLA